MRGKKLNVESVFKTPIYLDILEIISSYFTPEPKITIDHLKYIFLEKPRFSIKEKDKIEKDLSSTPFNRYKLKETIEEYKKNIIKDKRTYFNVKKLLSKNAVETAKDIGFFTEYKKIKTIENLRKYLRNLKELNIIEPVKRKQDSKPYYQLTREGLVKFLRFSIHKNIDLAIPDDALIELNLYMMLLAYKYRKIRM